ncbi:hypothetical protein MtrunA17_Chr7g0226841 [Medicago truncatula]|uniref:Uncharacterized protein n=1 Tax=Medicago truncatula TaxID=3880 RepID=A0A396GVH4_MEDTR|nr:hypothetical protein MtrunA17_Chr7g0226841 [Medicago truncatula]
MLVRSCLVRSNLFRSSLLLNSLLRDGLGFCLGFQDSLFRNCLRGLSGFASEATSEAFCGDWLFGSDEVAPEACLFFKA